MLAELHEASERELAVGCHAAQGEEGVIDQIGMGRGVVERRVQRCHVRKGAKCLLQGWQRVGIESVERQQGVNGFG
jgi:hypothetical protein